MITLTGASGDIGGSFLAHIASASPTRILLREGAEIPVPDDHTIIEKSVFRDGYIYTREFMDSFTECSNVVHCAALLSAAENTLVDYFAVNALFTSALASACLGKQNFPKFVYISTEMIYKLPDDQQLHTLATAFVDYCKNQFTTSGKALYDLRALARRFIVDNQSFPYDRYDGYALTKYLGEVVVQCLPRAAVVRVSNAYGPDYGNARLIPRLIVGRLTGHGAAFVEEDRDFVYSADLNKLLEIIIREDITGVIDCRSGELVNTQELAQRIVRLTPTAYGTLIGQAKYKQPAAHSMKAAPIALSDIIGKTTPFADGLLATLRHHREQCYHQMTDGLPMNDFLEPGERISSTLKGSSAAYLFAVEGDDAIRKIRKIAIREGIEGNGIAKVANEIRYYRHIVQHEPKIASLYPRLLDAKTAEAFSSETLEYLDGQNYYTALSIDAVPRPRHGDDLRLFIDTLCQTALTKGALVKDPDTALNVYYLERSLSRLHAILGHLEIHDTIRINGTEMIAPHVILAQLLSDQRLRRYILPKIEYFCFHGDLTLLNTVYLQRSREIKLIDPRGHIGAWDPLYDFAKIKFTLSGFGEIILGRRPLTTRDDGGYVIDFNCLPLSVRQLHDEFLLLLTSCKYFDEKIIRYEPYWRYRILLGEATHFLADIPFRLYTDGTPQTAIDSYLLGTYYLNQVYKALLHEGIE